MGWDCEQEERDEVARENREWSEEQSRLYEEEQAVQAFSEALLEQLIRLSEPEDEIAVGTKDRDVVAGTGALSVSTTYEFITEAGAVMRAARIDRVCAILLGEEAVS